MNTNESSMKLDYLSGCAEKQLQVGSHGLSEIRTDISDILYRRGVPATAFGALTVDTPGAQIAYSIGN